jgi:phosphoglycerol transferase MdoB-like AlkP superfamily enzyme
LLFNEKADGEKEEEEGIIFVAEVGIEDDIVGKGVGKGMGIVFDLLFSTVLCLFSPLTLAALFVALFLFFGNKSSCKFVITTEESCSSSIFCVNAVTSPLASESCSLQFNKSDFNLVFAEDNSLIKLMRSFVLFVVLVIDGTS